MTINPVLELGHLDSQTFEQMVNSLAITVLGPGLTTFGPGADGGRDAIFVGSAPYPSTTDSWTGTWYIQSKFHAPHLSKDAHQWLLEQIRAELDAFESNPKRRWPDIWIVATNIDPSGVPETGAYDAALALVKARRPVLAERFAIWGGKRILDYLDTVPRVAMRYGHFLTPGHLIAQIVRKLDEGDGLGEAIVKHLVFDGLLHGRRMKLDQAGDTDARSDIERLFVDLGFRTHNEHDTRNLLAEATYASAEHFSADLGERSGIEPWQRWLRDPRRAQTWLILAGPGTGKTTLGQFLCQIHRAANILAHPIPLRDSELLALAASIKQRAQELSAWPAIPRIPLQIDLSQYAQWYGKQEEAAPRGLLTYLTKRIHASLEEPVPPSILKSALQTGRWLLICDGLDEVPGDVKELVSSEITNFFVWARSCCDLFLICTSRPQGYSGQLKDLDGAELHLTPLGEASALECAGRLLKLYAPEDPTKGLELLTRAIKSKSIRQLMITPLQVHIMTIIVRQGQRPPEKKWELFKRFYDVIYLRESSKALGGAPEASLLRDERKLVAAVHKALGFVLHARAETKLGSTAALARRDFEQLVEYIVAQWKSTRVQETCALLSRASTERLVLISTPDSKELVRFDVRQLQEFFAAEFLLDGVTASEFRERLRTIAHDSHWREVLHFILSAILEQDRETELSVVLEVLGQMNEEILYGTARAIGNTILAGSVATAKLLEDGVLEPDKRVRERFRPLIKALGSARAAYQLDPLVRVRDESRAWLIEVMKEHISDSAEECRIGASLLVFLLSDNDCSQSIEMWSGWKEVNLFSVFRLLSHFDEHDMLDSQRLFKLASHPTLGPFAGVMLSLDGRRSRGWLTWLRESGHRLADHDDQIAQVSQFVYSLRSNITQEHDFGWVLVTEDSEAQPPSETTLASAALLVSAGVTGHFLLSARMVMFASSPNKQTLLDVLEASGSWLHCGFRLVMNRKEILTLPDSVGSKQALAHVNRMTEEGVMHAIKTGQFGLWTSPSVAEDLAYMPPSGHISPENVRELITRFPRAAATTLAMAPRAAALLTAADAPIVQPMVDQTWDRIARSPQLWHTLREVLGSEFRRALRDACTGITFELEGAPSNEFGQDLLLLPDDVALLIPVASHLISRLLRPRRTPPAHHGQASKEVASEAARWIQKIESLHEVVSGAMPDTSPETRLAAAIVGVCHPEGGLEFAAKHSTQLIECAISAKSEVVRALVWCVDMNNGLETASTRALLDQIISQSRWIGWEPNSESWFSRSIGTVAVHGKIPRWLRSNAGPEWLLPVA